MKAPIIRSKVVKVQAQTLCIHPYAQRELQQSKLRQLLKSLDLDAIGVLHGVEYEINGQVRIWIIDGQHRLKALLDLGFGEWEVEVKIHIGVQDDSRASELFLKLNNRAPVHPFDKYQNARRAGYPEATGVARIAEEHNLRVDRTSRDGLICCISVLTSAFKLDAGVSLSATLDTAIAAWGRTAAAVEGRLLEGIALVYRQFDGSVERPVLVKKLAKYPGGPSGLLGDARGMRQYRKASISRCVAERVIDLYNTGRRSGKLEKI